MNIQITALFLILAILVGGFYLVLTEISEIKMELKNLSFVLRGEPDRELFFSEIKETEEIKEEDNGNVLLAPDDIQTISTFIIFNIESNPTLQPTAELTLNIESASIDEKNNFKLDIRVWSGNAGTYTMLDLEEIFEIFSFQKPNIKLSKMEGSFNAIPPDSSISGSAFFDLGEKTSEVILQIKIGEDIIFYEFDFESLNYEKVMLG